MINQDGSNSYKGSVKYPYIGLRSFSRAESNIFFGREKHTVQLIEKLSKENFIAIVGTSGYGKSSLAHAGLLAGLDAGLLHGKHWWTVEMCPNSDPFKNLAIGLLKKEDIDNDILKEHKDKFLNYVGSVESLEGRLSDSPYSLDKILRDNSLPKNHNLLILVDQFEEIFSYYDKENKDRATVFIELLLSICQSNKSAYVVITMRSEYLDRCAVFNGLSESISKGIFLVPPMTDEELHLSIERPAKSLGDVIESDLVEQIIKDTKTQEKKTDVLPSIQHILMRMWNDNKNLTKKYYNSLDGLGDSLSGCADDAYDKNKEKSIEEQKKHQKIIRILFTCITERKSGFYIRRPTKLSVIADLAGVSREDVAKIIELFRNEKRRFLKPHLGEDLTEDSIIDITHEVLIHKWEKLSGWVDEEKRFTYIYNSLVESAIKWKKSKKDDNKLLSGVTLKDTRDWYNKKKPNVKNWVEHFGKNKGIDFDLAMIFLKLSNEKREQKKRRKKWTAKRSIALMIVSLIAVFIAIYAYSAKQKTEQALLKSRDSQFGSAKILASNENFTTTQQILNDNLTSEPKLYTLDRHAHNLLNWFSNLKGSIPEQTFEGSKAQLHTIAISPDGKMIATAGEKGKVVLFDKETEQLKSLKGHIDTIKAVVFDPQGKWLATAGYDKQIIFWSLPDGEELYRWQVSNKVWTLVVSPDGKILASGGNDDKISLWNIDDKTNKPFIFFEGHGKSISDLAFSSDGNLLVSSSHDKTVRLWDVKTAQELYTLKHTDKVQTIAFSSDGKLLATAGDDGEVYLYKTNSKQLQHTFKGHKSTIFGLSFIENNKYLVSASSDKNLRLWDVDSGVTLQVLQGHTARVTDVVTYKNQIFSSSNDRTVKYWNPLPLPNQYSLDLQKELASTAISPDGKKVVVGFADGTLSLYSLENRKLLWKATDKHVRDIQRLAFNSQGNLIVSASLDKTVKVWQDGELQQTFEHQDVVSSVAFAPNSNLIFTTSYDGQIGLFNPDTGKTNFIKQAHAGEEINSVTFNTDGKQLLTASDHEIRLWEVQDNSLNLLKTYPKYQSTIMWATISPNGKRYASVGRDNLVKIYSIKDGTEQYNLSGHDDSVLKAIFSSDNDQIATVSGDGTLRFWDLTSGNEIFKLRLPTKIKPPLWDFDFRCTKTGCWIAVPLTNGKLMLYDMGNIYD